MLSVLFHETGLRAVTSPNGESTDDSIT